MKLQCPQCSATILAANINLDSGWGKCESCNELFQLTDIIPGYTAKVAEPIQRPFNARAILERTTDELRIHVPAEGIRAASGGTMGFEAFWLAFVAFWTSGALGLFPKRPPQATNYLFACFSIPFWIAGFGMVLGIVWSCWAVRSI